ncbi:DUF861 domain containing protein [Nitzschia inconspicua]|uniref:DUF861 domain containing protein n=1 Tax=Nitzschia inconspicua TaxID=303405 RepID=A0A9K3KXI4_9STRA|nr:DUF861 domain containing protein [Nitzschia inconspicua]
MKGSDAVSLVTLFLGLLFFAAFPTATVAFSPISQIKHSRPLTGYTCIVPSSTSLNMSTETAVGPEIEVISKPDKEFLDKKGVFSWGTWGCGVSKFPWTYDSSESCYLLKGQVTVTPTDGRKPATFGAGDFVTFPAGMSCTWDVSEAVQKHFMFF